MNIRKIILEEIRLSLFEGPEHTQKLYKSWANKKSGNPEAALKTMDDVLKYQKRLPKKDFSTYSSYEELLSDINKIKQSLKSEDVTKFYEDNELVVIAANTWESSCKYGAGSKWCTTARDGGSDWDRHNQTGTEFFWIFKKKPQNDPNHKFSYHIKEDGTTPDWCNSINKCVEDTSFNSYPKQHPKYEEIINKLQKFHNSRDFQQYKSVIELNKELVVNGLMVYINEFIKNNTDEFSEIVKNYFSDELEYLLKWRGGTTVLMKVLKLSRINYVKGADDFINNRIKKFIENKFKNEDFSKYINIDLELIKERVTVDLFGPTSELRRFVFRVLGKKGIEIETSLILPQLEEKGLTIEDVISELSDRKFRELIIESIKYVGNDFTGLLNKEIYKFVEYNVDEFKKLLK